MFTQVKEKYNRRINRLYTLIKKHRKTLFVWWSKDKQIPNETILTAQERLSKLFKKPIYLLIFENKQNATLLEESLSPYSIKITTDLTTNADHPTQGCISASLPIFSTIKLRIPLTRKIQIFGCQVLSKLAPLSPWRKHFRARARELKRQ